MDDVKQYKCPYCAAELKYSADNHLFACEYCLSEFTEEDLKKFDKKNETDEKNEADKAEFENGTNLYSCPSCGAEIIADANTAATFCYYCHNPVILKGSVSGEYRPSKVLPFEFGKEKADEIFNKWAKKKWFVPKSFVSDKQIEKITGLYVPFWVADSDTTAHFDGIGKKIRTWTSGDYRYTETSEFSVVRDAEIKYSGIPADGSKKIEDELMEAIEPFDYSKTKDFSMAYLSGFLADKYDVDKTQVFPNIKERIESNNKVVLNNTMFYDTMAMPKYSTNIRDVKWNYMMLPVWFMTYKYKGETLEYAINGQSGKIAGRLPLAKSKLLTLCGIIGIIVMILVLIGGYIIW